MEKCHGEPGELGQKSLVQSQSHVVSNKLGGCQRLAGDGLKHAKDHCDFGVWGCCYDAHETPLGSFEVFPRTLLARVVAALFGIFLMIFPWVESYHMGLSENRVP